MKVSTPYDPENPFRAAASNLGSAQNLPSPSPDGRSTNALENVSLQDGDGDDSDPGLNNSNSHISQTDDANIKDLQDLATTGKWGSVSRKEVVCVGTTIALVLVAMIVAIVLFVGGDKSSPATPMQSGAPSMAPSGPTVAFESAIAEYEHLKEALKLNVLTSDIHLPKNSSELRALSQYEEDPYVSAAAWLMFKDPDNYIDGMLERFAVLSLYYTWLGDEWYDYKGWLLPKRHVCDWTGISCAVNDAGSKVVTEINLPHNKLIGTMPPTLGLLTELTSLRLNDNELSGKIDGPVIGSLEKLAVLELQNNDFSGALPHTLRGPNSCHFTSKETDSTGAGPFVETP